MDILRRSSARLQALATAPLLRCELRGYPQHKVYQLPPACSIQLLLHPSPPFGVDASCSSHPATRLFTTASFCSRASAEGMDDLAGKKCAPCSSKDIWAMSEHSANELLEKSELGIHGWDLVDDGGPLKLRRTWKTKSFMKGLEFFQHIAELAEAEGHHPDLHLTGWNNVKIELWTHSVGGVTENDFILAAKINALHVENLLRREPTQVDPSG